jgi:RNase H-fold protein (predicted Holliday junction resolvase)
LRNDKGNNGASQRILILITDGDERHSHYKLETLLALLREKKVEVYVIGFVQDLKQHGARTEERAIRFLSKLAEESGGRAYFPASMSEVKDIAGVLLDEIRRQR